MTNATRTSEGVSCTTPRYIFPISDSQSRITSCQILQSESSAPFCFQNALIILSSECHMCTQNTEAKPNFAPAWTQYTHDMSRRQSWNILHQLKQGAILSYQALFIVLIVFSAPEEPNRTHCSSLCLSDQTNNQSLHNTKEWTTRLVTTYLQTYPLTYLLH